MTVRFLPIVSHVRQPLSHQAAEALEWDVKRREKADHGWKPFAKREAEFAAARPVRMD